MFAVSLERRISAQSFLRPSVKSPAPHAEQATPDSDLHPTEPYPLLQRNCHLTSLGVDRWHGAGYRGKGIKIAILDSGFRGFRTHLGKALPAKITVRSFRADGNLEAKDSQHGILCSEVIHAIAPEAELLFANWDPDHAEQFLDAVRWSRQQGARIISCSLIMPSWSDGEGGGSFNDKLAHILGLGHQLQDILCFASAGNTAQRHWSGFYHANRDGLHEWQAGEVSNLLTPWGTGERVSVELCAAPGASYELIVLDSKNARAGRTLVHPGTDRTCTVVQFVPQANVEYRVQVRVRQGSGGAFHLTALGGGLHIANAKGSIPCPADNSLVLAVGAVNGSGIRASYSSCGPNARAPKPDFVAPVPFPSLWRARPFSGTSAAAPQAAAMAALYWSRHLDWTAEQVRRQMQTAARDLGEPGHDCDTGYGLVGLPEEPLRGDAK